MRDYRVLPSTSNIPWPLHLLSPCELSSFTSSPPPLLLQGNRRSDPFFLIPPHTFHPFLFFKRTLNSLGHPLSHLPFLYLSVCWGPLFQSRCTARLPCAFDRPNALPTQQRHALSSSHLSYPPPRANVNSSCPQFSAMPIKKRLSEMFRNPPIRSLL